MNQYNVLTEPWIVATDAKGEQRAYGLLELLLEARRLKAIVDPSPAIQFGIYRLLITFVQDALKLIEFEDLEDALLEEQFDKRVLEDYVTRIGPQRFDLFDTERPFLQSQPISGDTDRTKPVVEMFYHLPAGSNVLHFFHMEASDQAVSPAVAARALCSIAPFMVQGGAGYSPSINGTPPWYVLVKGDNLFETILLNCSVMEIMGIGYDAPPAWASDDNLVPKAEKEADSLAQGFTWLPRQVRLLPSDGGTCTYSGMESPVLIRDMAWGPGHKFDGHDRWLDPHVAYLLDDKRGRLPLRPREGRELWRDYGPLFLLRSKDKGETKYSRPVIVDQLEQLKSDRIVAKDKAELFEVYGMTVNQAKVYEWHYEVLPVETALLENTLSGSQVQLALDLAEKVSTAIYSALKRQHPRDGGGNRNALNRIIQTAQSEFWADLERYFEMDYLPALVVQEPDDESARKTLLEDWKSELRSIGRASFERASRALESGAVALQRQVLARNNFNLSLSLILDEKKTKRVRKEGA